jgi:hypothetical protein
LLGGRAVLARQHQREWLGERDRGLPVLPSNVQPPAKLAYIPRDRMRGGRRPGLVNLYGDVG